jgi:hypothetical protein
MGCPVSLIGSVLPQASGIGFSNASRLLPYSKSERLENKRGQFSPRENNVAIVPMILASYTTYF